MSEQSPVTYDAQSFVINGERTFLTSAAVHYPRIPRELWQDRILKAKAAGFNTLQLYFFWNVHEPEESAFNFAGQADVAHFLDLIADAGLYIVVRPGPYICAEWDGGGFPTWLYTKQGMETRTFNPIYLRAVENYWNHLLPILAERQITRGGKVILCQIENELNLGGRQSAALMPYMDALVAIAKRNGIDVPLITCEGEMEGAVECVNAHKPADRFADYRRRQPDAPLHCTEFWPGWYNTWDRPFNSAPAWSGGDPFLPSFTERETWRILAMGGAGYNYYMWHGGTNFAYQSMYDQTTEYFDTAPLSECGSLHEKYHVTRRVALFAQTFKDVLLDAPVYDPALHSQQLEHGVTLHRRETAHGKLWFLENTGPNDVQINLSQIEPDLPHHVRVPAEGVRPLVLDWHVGGTPMQFYAPVIVQIVEMDTETIVVAYDPDGEEHWAATDGEPCHVRRTVSPTGRAQTFLTLTPAQIARTWFTADGTIHLGPYFVREDGGRVQLELAPGTSERWEYANGQWMHHAVEVPVLPAPPVLTDWHEAPADAEAQDGFDDGVWTGMSSPLSRVALGDKAGYAWYRASIESDRPREASLTLTALADRALLFVNGDFVAVNPAPAEERDADPSLSAVVQLNEGQNTVAVLSDNMGHLKGAWCFRGRRLEEDKKGIFGPVLLDFSQAVAPWTFRPLLGFEHDAQDVNWQPLGYKVRPVRLFRTQFALPADELAVPDRELFLYPDSMGKGVVYVNGRNLGRFWRKNGHDRYYVPKCWLTEENELVLFEETDAGPTGARLAWEPLAIASVVEG